jgi:hypothetical protein
MIGIQETCRRKGYECEAIVFRGNNQAFGEDTY